MAGITNGSMVTCSFLLRLLSLWLHLETNYDIEEGTEGKTYGILPSDSFPEPPSCHLSSLLGWLQSQILVLVETAT